MRAKMSSRVRRQAAGWEAGDCYLSRRAPHDAARIWLGEESEREAMAILAETEPEGCGTHQRLTWMGDWAPEFAEALSSFIEARTDIPAAA